MTKSRFTESRISAFSRSMMLARASGYLPEQGISKATLYNWKSKYGGMQLNEVKLPKKCSSDELIWYKSKVMTLRQIYNGSLEPMKPFLAKNKFPTRDLTLDNNYFFAL